MGRELRKVTLSQLGRIVTGKTPPSGEADYYGGNIPFVTPTDFDGRRIINTTARCLTNQGANAVDGSCIPANAVMISCIGSDMGKAAIAGHDCVTNQQINSIIVQSSDDPLFVYYNLSGRKTEIRTAAGGSAQPILNKSAFGQLNILLPPLPEQKAIAHILGTLDDKIELNRRMNATLEAMARALFQSWFVDFDPVRAKLDGRKPVGLDDETAALFPDKFQDSELGRIPEGWETGKVDNLVTFSRASINPGSFPYEKFNHFSLPAFDNGRMPKCEQGSAIKSNKLVVMPDSVLLSKLNPHIPRIWLPDLRGSYRSVCSTEFIVGCAKPGVSREYLFSLFTSSFFASIYGTLVTGTTGSHQRIRSDSVLAMTITIPTPSLIQVFTEIARPMFGRAFSNVEQSCALASLRDALLPKLLSGDLGICNAERLILEAI